MNSLRELQEHGTQEYLFEQDGKIEFFGNVNDDLRISLISGENKSILMTADNREGKNDPCNWDDNICITDRNGKLLFASTWDGTSSISARGYQEFQEKTSKTSILSGR